MNEATETTREANPILVAIKRAMKLGGRPSLRAEIDTSAPSYQSDRALFTFTMATETLDRETYETTGRSEHTVERIPGWIQGGRKDATREAGSDWKYRLYSDDEANLYRPKSGYWTLYGNDTFAGILAMLPNHARIEFRVMLDWHTTPNHAKVGYHGDALLLIASWKQGKREITREFTIASSVGPHDSARFGWSSQFR